MFMSEFSFLGQIYRRKMKLIFFLLVLFGNGLKSTQGQLRVGNSSRGLVLRTYFNSYKKIVCCKYEKAVCTPFVDSMGEVASGYKGRIFTQYNFVFGFFDVIFIYPRLTDAGKYQCGVIGELYFDHVTVTIYDLQHYLKVRSSTSPSVLLESEKHTEEHSGGHNMVLTLAVVCSVVAVAVIISVTLLVLFRLKRWKKKSRDKSGNCGFHDNTLQNPQEHNGTIYSTVLFKSHEDQAELYANIQTQRPKHTDPSSAGVIQMGECEYSTILMAHT